LTVLRAAVWPSCEVAASDIKVLAATNDLCKSCDPSHTQRERERERERPHTQVACSAMFADTMH